MLKILKLSAALSATAVIVSLPQAVFSRPLSESSGYQVSQNLNPGNLYCYMRTQRGVVVNLENLCTVGDGASSGNRPANAVANPAANNNSDTRVYTFIGTPGEDTTFNGANTNFNSNPNVINTGLGGVNTNTNNTANGTNTNINTNFGATNTGTGTNTLGNGMNTNTNTNTNTNFGTTNTGTGANTLGNGMNTNFGGTNINTTIPQ